MSRVYNEFCSNEYLAHVDKNNNHLRSNKILYLVRAEEAWICNTSYLHMKNDKSKTVKRVAGRAKDNILCTDLIVRSDIAISKEGYLLCAIFWQINIKCRLQKRI